MTTELNKREIHILQNKGLPVCDWPNVLAVANHLSHGAKYRSLVIRNYGNYLHLRYSTTITC